ncbi:MAG: SAM-dependent methyltransferase [Neisseria sp.]|nr:SAM-dependent methyltransferase [Neisseria sp.]
MTGTLYLLPTPLGETDTPWLLPHDAAKIRPIRHFVVEAEKTARRHLKLLSLDTPLQQLHLSLLNEHTAADRLPEMLQPLLAGHDVALMSEAGCPAVADPGAALVALAHQRNIPVMPLVGPSSLLLALMASGANGQSFAFKGYLPAAGDERKLALRTLEKRIQHSGESQIFIETPYRNPALLTDMLGTLNDHTRLCIAADLTLPDQLIASHSIAAWKKRTLPDLKKRPCIFVLF